MKLTKEEFFEHLCTVNDGFAKIENLTTAYFGNNPVIVKDIRERMLSLGEAINARIADEATSILNEEEILWLIEKAEEKERSYREPNINGF